MFIQTPVLLTEFTGNGSVKRAINLRKLQQCCVLHGLNLELGKLSGTLPLMVCGYMYM